MIENIIKNLNLNKIVTSVSSTLDVANRLIPLYKEIEPMVNNTKKAINYIKEIGNKTANKIITNSDKNIKPIKEKISALKRTNSNNPIFFQ